MKRHAIARLLSYGMIKYDALSSSRNFMLVALPIMQQVMSCISSSFGKRTPFEDAKDCARRVKRFKSLYHSKDICELGFGIGEFMDAIVSDSKSVSALKQI